MADSANGSAATKDHTDNKGFMPLFYKEPMPLDKEKHKSLALKKEFGYNFTKDVNAVPINLIEFPQICHYYPIAFSPDDTATPVAILGLRDHENLYLHKDGRWHEGYIPAYVRRYPFIFSEVSESDRLTLCVDNNPDVLEEGGEQKFFDESGEPSELAKNALEFCKSYHGAAQQTQSFSKILVKHDLLVTREIQINVPGGQKINFSGFRIIDEEKLNGLSDEVFVELRKNGWLPFIYAQMFSGAQWQKLTMLLSKTMEK